MAQLIYLEQVTKTFPLSELTSGGNMGNEALFDLYNSLPFMRRFIKPPFNLLHQTQKLQAQNQFAPKLDQLVQAIKSTRFPVIVAGAGLSTMSLIPDYRSPEQTVLPTGAGRWNRGPEYSSPKQISAIDAFPNQSHFLVSSLVPQYFKAVVSQNVDTLLSDAGIPSQNIVHLHGQINQQNCQLCGKTYTRRYYCYERAVEGWDRAPRSQGRRCSCGGLLCDSVVHFGQSMTKENRSRSLQIAQKSDLILSLGSTLFVNSARKIVDQVLQRGGRLFQVNLQLNRYSDRGVHIQQLIHNVLPLLRQKLQAEGEVGRQVKFKVKLQQRGIIVLDHQSKPIDFIKSLRRQGQRIVADREDYWLRSALKPDEVQLYDGTLLTLAGSCLLVRKGLSEWEVREEETKQ